MVKKSDTFKVPDEWSFNNPHVIEHFDAHVRESLPWFDIATEAVVHIARCFVPWGGVVIDVGASTGNIGRALNSILRQRNALFFPFDSSPGMKAVYAGPGILAIEDAVQYDFSAKRPDLVICFLSLMFVPVRHRETVIRNMKCALAPGGAIIVVDKTEPKEGYTGTVNYRLTLAAKYKAGATPEEIIRKELSISGLQRPLSAVELSGFVEFFRFGDFVGAVWEKPA